MKKRVLCVDDEPRVLHGLTITLGNDFEVTTAASGAEALSLLETADPFPVIVIDMRMPGMGGAELAQRIRTLAPDTVSVVLTGYSTFSTAIAAVNEGHVFKFLSKPCPGTELKTAVHEAMDEHDRVAGDRETLRETLERTASTLANAEKLATLGTMAGSVGHEINNLATVFSGLISLLELSADTGESPSREDMEELRRVFDGLRSHGEQLLHLGRPADDNVGAVDLRDILRRTTGALRLAGVTKTIDVLLDMPPKPVVVRADSARLDQVFVNLLKNAADAVQSVKRDGRIRVVLGDRDGVVTCRIEDNGSGIPAAALPDIFEPYFTTKPPGRGTGLGLPVVKQIIESYGGRVTVRGEEDAGCEVVVTLPAEAAP